jgi:hypothetical protein
VVVNFFGGGNQKKNKKQTKNTKKNKQKTNAKNKANKLEKFNRYATCSSQILSYRIVSFYFLILFIYHINWKEYVLINLKLEKPIQILIISED